METLVKHTSETYDVVEYSDCNKIDTYYNFSSSRSSRRRKKHGYWNNISSSNLKEDYLKHYGNKLYSVLLHRLTIVLEKDETKTSIKIFEYLNHRKPGVHYFMRKKYVRYITYNKKTNIVYVGNSGTKISTAIRSNPFVNNEIPMFFDYLYNTLKRGKFVEGLQNNNEILFNIIKQFYGDFLSNFDVDKIVYADTKKIFLENYIKVHNIIVPNNYSVFFNNCRLTLRDIKRAKNNLLLAVEKKFKIKGKKFHRVLHNLEYFNPYISQSMVKFFGMDAVKQLKDNELEKILSIHTNSIDARIFDRTVDEFTPIEKKRIMNILLDCVMNNGSFRTLTDHIEFIYKLRYQYNENLRWESRNRDEFTKEHVFLSNLISKYQTGIFDRTYSKEFIDSFNTQFISNGGVYYPVLLMDDIQYKNESEIQHNCVKTYTKNVTCLIVSLREGSPDSDVRATIQFIIKHHKNKVKFYRSQTLGRFNRGLENNWTTPVEMLDKFVDSIEDKFKLSDFKITKTTFANSKTYDVTADDDKTPTVMFDDEKNYNIFQLIDLDF
jgi:hypothetical protein